MNQNRQKKFNSRLEFINKLLGEAGLTIPILLYFFYLLTQVIEDYGETI
jgi:hypothetical protein